MITLVRGEEPRSDESRRPGLRRFRRSPLERRGQQLAALTEVAAHEPEGPKRGDEPKGRGRITLEQPLEGDAEIFTLGREAPESLGLAGAAHFTVGNLSKCEVVGRVAVSQIICSRAGGELIRANSRIVSSIHTRSPLLRTRLLSSNAVSTSRSASHTASAASIVPPPAKTASRANSSRSGGSSSS